MVRRTVLALLLLCSSTVFAGRFSTAEFGPASATDIWDLVTEAFTRHYPADRWSIFMYSSVNRASNGALHCYAVAGVTPRDSDRFPHPLLQPFSTEPDTVSRRCSREARTRSDLRARCG